MTRTVVDYLKDIGEHMQKAQAFVAGMDYANFADDERTNFATVRAIEIIGEASSHIPDDVRARFPDVPWQDMTDMRNVVIHAYFGVDLSIVWQTVKVRIPQLLPAVVATIDTLETERQ